MSTALISKYKKSIRDSTIWSSEEVSIIWDFYVTKSVAASASQQRAAKDYGLKEMPVDTLLDYSGVLAEKREMLMADRIDGVLKEYGFVYMGKDPNTKEVVEIPIEIDSPRLVCMQPYSITDRNKPVAKGGGKGVTLLTHMRNSLAHGCTYFFDNGNMLLEDRAAGSSGKTTAMILLPQSSFLDWIKIIDIDGKYYFPNIARGDYRTLVVRSKPKKHE